MNTGNEPRNPTPGDGTANPEHNANTSAGRPRLLIALAVLLWAETALTAGIALWLLIELLTATPSSVASGLAILALAVIAAAWLAVTAVKTLQARSWVRGSAVTWQILQFAIAIGFFQGADARPGLAWALLIPAVLGVALALSPSVIGATARIRSEDDDRGDGRDDDRGDEPPR